MRIVGFILIVLGAVALTYALSGKPFTYTKEEEIGVVGPIKGTFKHPESIDVPIWAGAAPLAVGVLLVIAGRKR
jgi:hypothetical protein